MNLVKQGEGWKGILACSEAKRLGAQKGSLGLLKCVAWVKERGQFHGEGNPSHPIRREVQGRKSIDRFRGGRRAQ